MTFTSREYENGLIVLGFQFVYENPVVVRVTSFVDSVIPFVVVYVISCRSAILFPLLISNVPFSRLCEAIAEEIEM